MLATSRGVGDIGLVPSAVQVRLEDGVRSCSGWNIDHHSQQGHRSPPASARARCRSSRCCARAGLCVVSIMGLSPSRRGGIKSPSGGDGRPGCLGCRARKRVLTVTLTLHLPLSLLRRNRFVLPVKRVGATPQNRAMAGSESSRSALAAVTSSWLAMLRRRPVRLRSSGPIFRPQRTSADYKPAWHPELLNAQHYHLPRSSTPSGDREHSTSMA